MTQTRRRITRLATLIALSLPMIGGALRAQQLPDLGSLSVGDLMNVEVTSVSRKGQKLANTAAAVFVITQDDIRASGATSIPEVLRIVPGLDVARVNGNVWAISARGFNGRFANKLLVMIDGRSVYTPLFSGVYWDVQDTMLEDVERIEVIRGPGGTLWGANAVNGIINIITKHPIETQGALVTVGGGDTSGSSVAGRFGGSIGHNGYYRAFAKQFDHPAAIEGVNATHDAWEAGRAGFRADWVSKKGDNFTAQGDIYRGSESTLGLVDPGNPFADRAALVHVAGESLQFRWNSVQSSRSDTTVQSFYDYTARSQPSFTVGRRAFAIDFQQHRKLDDRNDTVWGVDYRLSDDRVAGPGLQLVRASNRESIASAFVQDEIQLTKQLHLTVGTKVEYDRASRLQWQPTVRLLLKPSETQTLWAAATSAVRTPSEIELYGRMNVAAFPMGGGNIGLVVVTGNPQLKPERIESYEAGYRWQAAHDLVFDATLFHNQLNDLVATVTKPPFLDAAGRTVIPVAIDNGINGKANGAEFLLTHTVTTAWNVALGYAFFRSDAENGDAFYPEHQWQLRSSIHLPQHVELDPSAYYVGRVNSSVPAYLRLDLQLSWRPAKRLELSIAGQNLLRANHYEFGAVDGDATTLAAPVQRTVNGKITWRF